MTRCPSKPRESYECQRMGMLDRCRFCGGRMEQVAKFVAGSETSHAAAVSIEPRRATWRRKVLEAIMASDDGMTDEELQLALNLNPSTERPRRIELVDEGSICDSGTKRNTTSGRSAVVWRVAP